MLFLLFVLMGIEQIGESYAEDSLVKDWVQPGGGILKLNGYVKPIRDPKVGNSSYYKENQDSNPWRSCAFKDYYKVWPKDEEALPFTQADEVFKKMKVDGVQMPQPNSQFISTTNLWVNDFQSRICRGKKAYFTVRPQDYSSPKAFFELDAQEKDSSGASSGSFCPIFVYKNEKKSSAKYSSVDFFGNPENPASSRTFYYCKPWEFAQGNSKHYDAWIGDLSKFDLTKVNSANHVLNEADNVRLCLLGLVKKGVINSDFKYSNIKFYQTILDKDGKPTSNYKESDLECTYPKIGEKIAESVTALKNGLKLINDKYYNFKVDDKKLPSLSLDFCPEYLDSTADIIKKNLESLSSKNFSHDDVTEYYKIASNITVDAPKYRLHYFRGSCIHPVSLVADEPENVSFLDNVSKLSSTECQKIVKFIDKQYLKIKSDSANSNADTLITGLTLLSSASTLNNGQAKDGSEYFYPKQFKELSDARLASVQKCILDSSNYKDELKKAVVGFNELVSKTPATSAEQPITKISAGTNQDGTTGECAYECAEDSKTPRYCEEKPKDFFKESTLTESEKIKKKDEILNSYQFTTYSVKFLIKRKAPKANGHYLGAAQRCFRVSLSCGR